MSFPFDQVVITFPDEASAVFASNGPLRSIQSQYSTTEIVASTDPHTARVGSGGGTLAAISSTKCGQTILVLHAGGESSRCPTQMVVGKAWTSLPCGDGKGLITPVELWLQLCQVIFTSIPRGSIVVVATDILLEMSSVSLSNCSKLDWQKAPSSAVLGLAVLAPLETAQHHGVFTLREQNQSGLSITPCCSVRQKPSISEMREHCQVNGHPMAWIDSGIVICLPGAANSFRELAEGPLKLCTAKGLQDAYELEKDTNDSLASFSRRRAFKIDIYTHIMHALTLDAPDAPDLAMDDPNRRNRYVSAFPDIPMEVSSATFDILYKAPLHVLTIPDGHFLHLGTTKDLHEFLLEGSFRGMDPPLENSVRTELCRKFGRELNLCNRLLARTWITHCEPASSVYHSVVSSSNPASAIGGKTVVEHSFIDNDEQLIRIGKHCLVSGVRCIQQPFVVPDEMCVQMLPYDSAFVYLVLGIGDPIKSNELLYGKPLQDFLMWTELSEQDLWDDDAKRVLWTARLHPVMATQETFDSTFSWLAGYLSGKSREETSLARWKQVKRLSLAEIRDQADAAAEFQYREGLATHRIHDRTKLHLQKIRKVFLERQHKETHLQYSIDDFNQTGSHQELEKVLNSLDDVFQKSASMKLYDIAGRVCSVMSDIFYQLGSRDMACICSRGVPSPSKYGHVLTSLRQRSSSHAFVDPRDLSSASCESFGHSLVSLSEALTFECIYQPVSRPNDASTILDKWIVAAAPVRVDLAGAWSDTPPICYEFGAAVTGVAVSVNDVLPLSARCRIVTGSRGINLCTESRDISSGDLRQKVDATLNSVDDLADCRDPTADCALLKCALICLGLTTLDAIIERKINLQHEINRFCRIAQDVRIEIVSTSMLPHGSGLGTSSILGGCILAAIGKCIGIDFKAGDDSMVELIDQVSVLEQLLTTGGGWQDQSFGLSGGFNTFRCTAQALPLLVTRQQVKVSKQLQDDFESRLCLVFTGKTRLAKNILRQVLSRWSRRSPEMVDTVNNLVIHAEKARELLSQNDISNLAHIVDSNWELKKTMAGPDSGVEPDFVKEAVRDLRDQSMICAAMLCGAGGGGFMALLLNDGVSKQDVRNHLQNNFTSDLPFEWFDSSVCCEGLTLISTEAKTIDDFDMSWIRIQSLS